MPIMFDGVENDPDELALIAKTAVRLSDPRDSGCYNLVVASRWRTK